VGAFYTGTEKGGSADETDGEAYYRFGFNEHLHVSLTSQVLDAARSDDTVWNVGLTRTFHELRCERVEITQKQGFCAVERVKLC
jgi:hypothetical protein